MTQIKLFSAFWQIFKGRFPPHSLRDSLPQDLPVTFRDPGKLPVKRNTERDTRVSTRRRRRKGRRRRRRGRGRMNWRD